MILEFIKEIESLKHLSDRHIHLLGLIKQGVLDLSSENLRLKDSIRDLEDLQQSNKDLLNTIIEAQKVIKNV